MSLDPRTEFHRVVIKSVLTPSSTTHSETDQNQSQMVLKAFSTGGQRSSRVASLAKANGLVILPQLEPLVSDERESHGKRKTGLEVGEFAQAIMIGEIEMV